MKYSASALLVLATSVAAQSIADLPGCSLSCVLQGVTQVGCTVSDFECSCKAAAELTPAITPCVQDACTNPADQAKVITVLGGICASAGFPITIPEPEMPAPEEPETPAPEEPETPAPEEPETPAPEEPEEPAPEEPESSSVAPTIQTSVPTPSATDVVITSGYGAMPTSAPADETCTVVTYTETVTEAPYPTGSPSAPVGTGAPIPVPSGSASYSAYPPEFTGAAAAVKLPAGIAGVLGLAALML